MVLSDLEETVLRQLDTPATSLELAMACDHCARTLLGAVFKVRQALGNLYRMGYIRWYRANGTVYYVQGE